MTFDYFNFILFFFLIIKINIIIINIIIFIIYNIYNILIELRELRTNVNVIVDITIIDNSIEVLAIFKEKIFSTCFNAIIRNK